MVASSALGHVDHQDRWSPPHLRFCRRRSYSRCFRQRSCDVCWSAFFVLFFFFFLSRLAFSHPVCHRPTHTTSPRLPLAPSRGAVLRNDTQERSHLDMCTCTPSYCLVFRLSDGRGNSPCPERTRWLQSPRVEEAHHQHPSRVGLRSSQTSPSSQARRGERLSGQGACDAMRCSPRQYV